MNPANFINAAKYHLNGAIEEVVKDIECSIANSAEAGGAFKASEGHAGIIIDLLISKLKEDRERIAYHIMVKAHNNEGDSLPEGEDPGDYNSNDDPDYVPGGGEADQYFADHI